VLRGCVEGGEVVPKVEEVVPVLRDSAEGTSRLCQRLEVVTKVLRGCDEGA